MALKVSFHPDGRSARRDANPDYPDGIHVRIVGDVNANTCRVELLYPAVGCGVWLVECDACGFRGGCTAAGGADDPRSMTVPCRPIVAGPGTVQ